MNPQDIDFVADRLRTAKFVCVSTGAGMSAESGVATFRDAQTGLWSKFNAEELATPQAFARDPKFVWAWYRERRAKLAAVRPHVGHRLLAEWEQRVPKMAIVTQNIDGLHHVAGSKNVIELHGRLDVARCTECHFQHASLEDLGEDPRCEACGERLRPGVVWFGEMLPPGAMEAAATAAHSCDVFVVIGTSGVVQPAASLAETAKWGGATVIEINPDRTPISALADVCLQAKCGEALSKIDEAWRRRGS